MCPTFDHWAYCGYMLTVLSMYSACFHWVFESLSPVSEEYSILHQCHYGRFSHNLTHSFLLISLMVLTIQWTIFPILIMFLSLMPFFFCSYSFTPSKIFEQLLLERANNRSRLLGATFFKDLLGLGQIPFHCYYGGVLDPPQGFHCEV